MMCYSLSWHEILARGTKLENLMHIRKITWFVGRCPEKWCALSHFERAFRICEKDYEKPHRNSWDSGNGRSGSLTHFIVGL